MLSAKIRLEIIIVLRGRDFTYKNQEVLLMKLSWVQLLSSCTLVTL